MSLRPKIAVNTRFLIKGKLEGIGLFTQEVMRELVLQHPEVDFHFLFDRAFDADFVFAKNVHPVVLYPSARHPLLWFVWFQWSVARWLKKNKPALFISPDGYCTLGTKTPTITVIHDLAFEHFPNHVGTLVRAYYKYFVPRFIKHSKKIITVSAFTKQDVIKQYGTDAEKIEVVYNAAKSVYKPISEHDQLLIKNKIASGKDFFVYVGSIHPRKNIINLLYAFDAFKRETLSDVKLVLIGRKAWQYDEVETTVHALTHKSDVHFLGHLPSEETADIVASSIALCYVSLFEGFGIPIVEAQQAGTAVITSNISSMPEAAGDAAILVEPTSLNELATAMKKVSADNSFRKELIEKGFVNIKRFSWKKSAERLWDIASPLMHS